MKNNSGSKTGKVFRRIFNFRSWSDWDRTKSSSQYVKDMLKKLFVIQPKVEESRETFAEAVERLKLTQADLEIRQNGLLRSTIIMAFIAFFFFMYVIYQVVYGTLLSGLASFSITLIALALAFRYHFWYYQIKQQKLGCTVREWFKQGILGDHS
jgi:intracellular multiplication protein IcmV